MENTSFHYKLDYFNSFGQLFMEPMTTAKDRKTPKHSHISLFFGQSAFIFMTRQIARFKL